uniref:Uncharacterized protein n=1 Tax=Meloidogyne incognita TaxID=6306 RepID=A0A914MT88_MELIC
MKQEQVEIAANEDLVSQSISIGLSGMYKRFIWLQLRVDGEHYQNLANICLK